MTTYSGPLPPPDPIDRVGDLEEGAEQAAFVSSLGPAAAAAASAYSAEKSVNIATSPDPVAKGLGAAANAVVAKAQGIVNRSGVSPAAPDATGAPAGSASALPMVLGISAGAFVLWLLLRGKR